MKTTTKKTTKKTTPVAAAPAPVVAAAPAPVVKPVATVVVAKQARSLWRGDKVQWNSTSATSTPTLITGTVVETGPAVARGHWVVRVRDDKGVFHFHIPGVYFPTDMVNVIEEA